MKSSERIFFKLITVIKSISPFYSIQVLFFVLVMWFTFQPVKSYSKTPLKAGIAKVDITPSETLYMGGYAETCRMNPSDGVFGNIYIRALVFDDSVTKVVFIEANIVGIPDEMVATIRNLVEKETGIPKENIMLGGTHNHAAPSMDDRNSKTEWYRQFDGKVVQAVKKAVVDLEPVRIGGCIGKSNMGMNRRKKMKDTTSYLTFDENNSSQSYGKYKTDTPVNLREIEGVYRIGANPEGPIDDALGIMRVDKLSGEPKAIFINYACHGTSLGGRNNKVSPEWNGHMLEYIEKELPGVTGIFAQGAAGDINPRFIGGLEGYKDDLENTARLGYEMGKEVVAIFNNIKTDDPVDSHIKIVHKDVTCPLRYGLVATDFKNTTVNVPSTGVRIDNFVWVTFPGELFHEIGQVIKSSTHARYPFLVGYCNGSLGYMPTQKAFSEGGYEPWRSRFAPITEKIYTEGVAQMLIGLH